MNKRLNIVILVTILSFLTVFGFSNNAKAGAVITNDTENATPIVTPDDGGMINPSADDSNGSGAVINPSGDDQTSGGAVINPSGDDMINPGSQGTVNPSADDEVTSAAVVTPVNNGGSSSGSSGSYSSGASRVNVPLIVAGTNSCPLINSFMKLGGNNNVQDVLKLQSFLAGTEKMNVKVTGVFDEQTKNAVMSFQTKYSADILAPYNATRPTGDVVITTKKKVNAIACASKVAFTADELSTIKAITARLNSTVSAPAVEASTNPTVGPSINTEGSDAASLDTDTDADANVAAASNPNIVKKFWNFIVNLFR